MNKPVSMYQYATGQLDSHIRGVLPPVPAKEPKKDNRTFEQVKADVIKSAFSDPRAATLIQDDIRREMVKDARKMESCPTRQRRKSDGKLTPEVAARRSRIVETCTTWKTAEEIHMGVICGASRETVRIDIVRLRKAKKLVSFGSQKGCMFIRADYAKFVDTPSMPPLSATKAISDRREAFLRAVPDWTAVVDIPEGAAGVSYENTYTEIKRLMKLGVMERKTMHRLAFVRAVKGWDK